MLALICLNWFDWRTNRFYTLSHCPPPPSVSVLSLLPPPCLPFLNETAGMLQQHGVVPPHACFSAVCIYVPVRGKPFHHTASAHTSTDDSKSVAVRLRGRASGG